MLTSSFIFLPGVGPTTERRWWDEGLLDWDMFLNRSSVPGLSAGRKHWYDGELRTARDLLDNGHFHSVATQLPGMNIGGSMKRADPARVFSILKRPVHLPGLAM